MKTFEIFESRINLTEQRMFDTAIALCESLEKLLEDGLDWEPQPEHAGKTGTATDTGFGIQSRQMAKDKQGLKRFAGQWNKLKKTYMALRGRDDRKAIQLYQKLKQLAVMAEKKGMSRLEMPPAPPEETTSPY